MALRRVDIQRTVTSIKKPSVFTTFVIVNQIGLIEETPSATLVEGHRMSGDLSATRAEPSSPSCQVAERRYAARRLQRNGGKKQATEIAILVRMSKIL